MYVYDVCAAHFTPIAKLIEICNRNLLILLRQRAQGIPNHKVQRSTVDHIEEEFKLQTCLAFPLFEQIQNKWNCFIKTKRNS